MSYRAQILGAELKIGKNSASSGTRVSCSLRANQNPASALALKS